MRKPLYISPSALSIYQSDKEKYFLQYLASDRGEREGQTAPMAVGSAFDAFAKSYLHERIYGKNHKDAEKYDLRKIFESQVDPIHWEQMWLIGSYLFEQYKISGSISDLMLELANAADEPRFEFSVQGVIHGPEGLTREGKEVVMAGVPLLGKPDVRFTNKNGVHVILDWKINSFFAKSNSSPMQGYVKLREQYNPTTYDNKGKHKNAYLLDIGGIKVNSAGYLEEWNPGWAAQLATYCWLLGDSVGAETIVGIEQVNGDGTKRFNPVVNGITLDVPRLRISSHRARVSMAFQNQLICQYQALWNLIHSEPFHYFTDLSLEDSQAKCAMLDERARFINDPNLTDDERWALAACKPQPTFYKG